MSELFVRILNVGITGGWIALGVVLLRPLLKKTPRWVLCLLWALVALRLLLPFELYSPISLLPSTQVIPTDIATTATPAIHSGFSSVNEAVNPVLTEYAEPETHHIERLLALGTRVWLVGIGVLLCYSLISCLRLYWQVRVKVRLQKKVYMCDGIDSPFILGVLFPRIYLPSTLSQQQQADVLAHEFAHLKRRDHWWKPLGFMLLCVYWFNPLLWVSYILLCRDIEQACDEKVIAAMTPGEKSRYANTLLQCSVRRKMASACPVAFGETGVKSRIKGVLSYKKPGFWVILLSLVVCGVVAVCFLTNPLPCKHDYSEAVLTAPGCTQTGREKLTCRKCDHSYVSRTPMTAHHYEDGEILTQPTCTSMGLREQVCVDCGHTVTAKIEMTAHNLEDGQVRVQPTCTSVGVRNRFCVECGSTVTAPIEKTAHIPGVYTIIEPATCSKEGVANTNCTACGIPMKISVPVNPENHNMQEKVLFRNSCTSLGKSQFTCQWCNHKENRYYSSHGHQNEFVSRTESTCTKQGWEYYTCQICGYRCQRSVSALGHQYELVSRTESTCKVQGEELYKCKTCGDKIRKSIAVSVHQYDLVSRTAPTCTANGEELYKCKTCGETTKTVLLRTSHHYDLEDQCVDCGHVVEYIPWV